MADTPQVTQIILPALLTDEQRRLLVKYARLPRSLTRAEWGLALAAFDLLHAGRVILDGLRRAHRRLRRHAVLIHFASRL